MPLEPVVASAPLVLEARVAPESPWPTTPPTMLAPTARITTAPSAAKRKGLPHRLAIRYSPNSTRTPPRTRAITFTPANTNATTPAASATKPRAAGIRFAFFVGGVSTGDTGGVDIWPLGGRAGVLRIVAASLASRLR